MADFDPAAAAFVIPWWGVIAILVLVAALALLAMFRAGPARVLGVVAQLTAALVIAFGGWTILDRMSRSERAGEQRVLEKRVEDLAMHAMAPGSALGCLDPVAADAFDESCEKALFASPESVAGTISFVSSRLLLLSDLIDYQVRNPGRVDEAILNLRRVLERDRYGFVAHILATRDSCTEDRCDTFDLFGDTGRIVANLQGHSFETRLERAAAAWLARQPQTASAAPAAPNAAGAAVAPVTSANFPTSNSIPPVSIMNNEPGIPGQNGVSERAEPKEKAEAKEIKPVARKPAEKPAARRGQGTAPQGAAPIPITPTADAAPSRAQ